jgi:hypothetical protein
MNGVLPSLCLLGAALATANMLIMQRPTCPARGTEVAAAGNDVPSTKTEVVSTGKAEPANAPLRAKPPVPPKGVDVTGSVKQPKKTDQKQSAQAESKLREKVAAAGKGAPSTKTEFVSTAKAEASNAAARAGVDVTGSVKRPKKTDQKQSAQTESKRDETNLVAPAQPGPYARPYRPRKHGWRWHYGYPPPPVGFAIRVYPRW